MKKLTNLFIFTCLVINAVSAQKKITYGFEAGITTSFFETPNAPHKNPDLVSDFDKNTRPGLELALKADMPLSDAFFLSSGLEYVERGGSYRTKNPGVVYVDQVSGEKADDAYNYLRYRLAYFEVPLRLKYKLINITNEESWNIFAGPTAMVNVASKRRYNSFEGGSKPEEKWDADKLPGANTFVVGWNAGVEWRAQALIIYAKYLGNLTELYDTAQTGYENFDTDMHSISLGMGFTF